MQPNHRRCVSCRRTAHRNELLRVVRSYQTGLIQINHGMGRSAYLCRNLSCLMSAQKKNRLGRSLKAPIPEIIYENLHQQLQ